MQRKTLKKMLAQKKTLVMGILNVTPDSFSDGGKYNTVEKAVKRAMQMEQEGADIIDIGGESTGPGSKNVTVECELQRVLPVLKLLRNRSNILISVDTYKAEVAKEVLQAGADLINDVTALRGDKKMAVVIAESGVPLVLMYSKDNSARTILADPGYNDVLKTITDFLQRRIKYALTNGIKRDQLIVDPGMGAFVSSNPIYSLQILSRLASLKKLKLPILIGPSRKSYIGKVLDLPINERLEATLAACVTAQLHGASILRVHDVKETRRVVDMVNAITNS